MDRAATRAIVHANTVARAITQMAGWKEGT